MPSARVQLAAHFLICSTWRSGGASLATTSSMPRGAKKLRQPTASALVKPASARAGTSGSAAVRVLRGHDDALRRLPFTWSVTAPMSIRYHVLCSELPIRSCTASAPPR